MSDSIKTKNRRYQQPFRILFVDDEESQRKMFSRVAQGEYIVELSSNVEDAKKSLIEHSDNIAVIVSDVRMPKSSGLELIEFCHENYPDIIRILFSAYAESSPKEVLRALNDFDVHRYLQKPLSIDALRSELSNAVDVFFKKKVKMSSINPNDVLTEFKLSCEKWLHYLCNLNESINCLEYGLQAIANEYNEKILQLPASEKTKEYQIKIIEYLDDFIDEQISYSEQFGDGKFLKQRTQH